MSETKPFRVEAVEISDVKSLDPIQVFWRDVEPGRGSVTITCYGCAWTAYFGGMVTGKTIRQFFASCDTGYLVNKLGITPLLKCRKRDDEYLARIIGAVKESIAADL